MGFWTIVFGALFGLANAYWWLTVLAARRFAREPAAPAPEPATIIIPLKGGDPGLERGLARFCRQDARGYQLIVVVESADDPAADAVRRLRERFPQVELVVSGGGPAANPKENSHAAGLARARHSLIVLTDGDVEAAPDYLRTVLAPLRDPAVGLVTCPYRFVGGEGLWAALKATTIEAGFMPSTLVAWLLAPVRFGIGATLAFRRDTLSRIGGIASVSGELASDYRLADAIARSGLRVAFLPYFLPVRLEPLDGTAFCRWQLRWARTMRLTAPAGYLGLAVTHGLVWAAALSLALGSALPAAAGLASRWLSTALVRRACFGRVDPLRLAVLPLGDLCSFAFWACGLFGDEVRWAGRRFKLAAGTRIVAVSEL